MEGKGLVGKERESKTVVRSFIERKGGVIAR